MISLDSFAYPLSDVDAGAWLLGAVGWVPKKLCPVLHMQLLVSNSLIIFFLTLRRNSCCSHFRTIDHLEPSSAIDPGSNTKLCYWSKQLVVMTSCEENIEFKCRAGFKRTIDLMWPKTLFVI